MQVQVKPLLAELQWVDRFIEKKTTIPILSNAMFEVNGKRLTLTGTDLETAGVTSVDGVGRSKWSVTAPVGKLIKYLQKIDEPEVTLGATPEHYLTVTHGTSAQRTAGMSKESYPELPAAPEKQCTLGRLPLAVKHTSFAITKEESRFTLSGALLEIDEDEARMVATDGHRLSLSPVQAKGTAKVNALVRKPALVELAKMDGDCAFSVDDDHAFFDFGQRRIVTRKLTGNFPDWRRVLGDDMPNHGMIPVKTTIKVLERVALYADERSRAVIFTVGAGTVTISANTVEGGSAKGEIPIQRIDGVDRMPIGLNADYILEFLRTTDAQNVAFCWKTAKDGVQFVTPDGVRYCVMPMRI